jgi:predicted nucleotidyltransferase
MTSRRLHRITSEERHRIEQYLAAELASDPGMVFAYLYGSFVESQPFHDIDVGVYLQTVRADRVTATALDLTQRLSDGARIPVDVRILNVAPVSFLYHVLRGQLVFCRDDAVLAEVMERTVSRYLDIAPLVRRGTQEAFAA